MDEFDVFYRSTSKDDKGNDDPLRFVRVKAIGATMAVSEARKARSDIHYVIQVKLVV